MRKIIKAISRQKLIFNYGWGWACAPMIVYVTSRELQHQLGEWHIAMKLWVIMPAILAFIWAASAMMIRMGAMRAENDMAAENSTWVENFVKKFHDHKEGPR